MVMNESEALRWVARQWQRLSGKMVFQVSAECCESFASVRTSERRLFQIAGAAERKLRALNEMLQRVKERRLAEADRRVLHGGYSHGRAYFVPLDKVSTRYGGRGVTGIYCFMRHCYNFKFNTTLNRQPV